MYVHYLTQQSVCTNPLFTCCNVYIQHCLQENPEKEHEQAYSEWVHYCLSGPQGSHGERCDLMQLLPVA